MGADNAVHVYHGGCTLPFCIHAHECKLRVGTWQPTLVVELVGDGNEVYVLCNSYISRTQGDKMVKP